MLYEFKFPDVGEGIAEGEIVKWHAQPNDVIVEDQLIVEVQTDKAIVEISSPVGGKIEKLHGDEGENIEVGSILVSIETNKSTKSEPPKESSEKNNYISKTSSEISTSMSVETSSAQKRKPGKYLPIAVPSVRKLARELKVDLTMVTGTGKGGRITEQDVRSFLDNSQSRQLQETTINIENPQSLGEEQFELDERVPLKGIRKQIAQNMMKSTSLAALSTVMDDANITELISLKEKMAEKAMKRGVKLTYLPYIIKAVVTALQEYPYLNSTIDLETQEIILKKRYNIGVAVDTPSGLMVPVIKQADKKSIRRLAKEIVSLSEKARNNKLKLEDMQDGTFTISNIGATRSVKYGTPIVNHPEVAILGVNKIHKKPVIVNNEIAIGDVVGLSLAFDHQVIDGVLAANFLKRVIEFLEQPDLFLLEI
ncbi:dihydrolipoamide acetyltransferase family protein [Bacillus sp. V5-8f]|uniref:dihydrolipoamide acetyltransferase family protein n=1 Tax=Bacillus sp. V5-8f TaxID=2053044 RepID=UPI000C77C81F|nr:dihydrolipoamide acetyltransferase family protein [Bacillus sp. V5-8f]PLT35439.1 hypothetical protein CUU64_02170 [Bacillus sp. V5-8f]